MNPLAAATRSGRDPRRARSHGLRFISAACIAPLALLALALTGCGNGSSNPALAATGTVQVQRVFPRLNFVQPTGAVKIPGTSDWWVFERNGLIRRASGPDPEQALPVADLSDRVDASATETGLLGVALHPGFTANGRVVVSYTRSGTPLTSVISQFISNDGGVTLDEGSETIILTIDQPFANHNGGHVAFGPDGFLYVGLGDGGSPGDVDGNAQNTNFLLGKILRIDVDGMAPYAIPPDNPFAAGGGAPEVWAFGFRNPWRFQFDRGTGELWAGDVGQSQFEEVDVVMRGGNYGWNIREGAHCFEQAQCTTVGLIDPVDEYDHTEGCSITGGFVYRGSNLPALMGSFVFGDFCSGRIWAFDGANRRLLADTTLRIVSFAEDETGELLIIDFDGTIQSLGAAPAASLTGG